VGNAGLLELVLAFADGGDLRIGVDHVRDRVVVHVPGLAGKDFRNGNALVFGLMRQHRARDDIADGPDARDVGRVIMVDNDASALVLLHADAIETKAFGVGHAADGDEHDIGLDRLRRATLRRLDAHLERLARSIDRGDLGGELEDEALLLEQALRLAADLAVHAGQRAVEKFDHGDLRPKAAPHRAKLEPDDAGANDKEALRDGGQLQRSGRRHNALLVDLDAAQLGDIGAGGDHDRLRLQRLRLAIIALHFDLAGRGDAAGTAEGVDLVLLQQEVDALDVAFDAFVLELHHRREIELRLADADAHHREVLGRHFEHIGGVQQRLRWDAAYIEAGAAEGGALFHHRGLQAKLRRADGADVTAGAGANDDEIVSHNSILSLGADARITNRPRGVRGLREPLSPAPGR